MAVDCLPHKTRLAMLEGLERYDRIIVGAYSDRAGGVCPMLAAHRLGGRTDFRTFARVWDRFTGAGGKGRKATERELRTLAAQLEASLWKDQKAHSVFEPDRDSTGGGQKAVPAPVAAAGDRAAPAGRTAPAQGASWLIPFRRWDRYNEAIHAAHKQIAREPARDPAADATRSKKPVPTTG